MKKFWDFKAKDETTGELILYGEISAEQRGEAITPKDFKVELDVLGNITNLNIFINSIGGNVFAGQAIHSLLKRHNAFKTVYIDGIAASVASVIAMAGDKIIMPKNASMMIHNSWAATTGNKEELRKMADVMDKVDTEFINIYAERTGLDKAEIALMMDSERWFTAEEAVKYGFADEVEEARLIAASMDGNLLICNGLSFDLEKYKHKPNIIATSHENEPPDKGGFLVPDNGGGSQPVEDNVLNAQRTYFTNVKKKLLEV